MTYSRSNVRFWGCVRSPFLCRSTPLDALKRLIGLRETVVNQAREVFKGFGRREPESYQAHNVESQAIL